MTSRIENILQAMIDGTSSEDLPNAQSRNEALLLQILDKLNESDVDPEVIAQAVSDWLDDHPEATTTVEDGSISYAKLDAGLKAKADDVDSLKSTTDSLETYVRNMSPVATVTAPVASVSDAAPLDADDVTIAIEPVQDLHGYDNPWPAGGGKNLLNNGASTITEFGVTCTVYPDGTVNVNGTATDEVNVYIAPGLVLPTGNYILSGCPLGGSASTYRLFATNFGSDIGAGLSFTADGSTPTTVRINIKSGVVCVNLLFKPMIRLASETDASFTPYSNICPITGWTGAEISHSGADTSNPDVISVAFPSEAGTVYGGTLDLTKGKLTVDRAYRNLNDTSKWISSTGTQDFAYADDINNRMIYSTSFEGLVCTAFPVRITSDGAYMRWTSTISKQIGIKNVTTSYTLADIQQMAQNGEIAIVYELATPITYDLTPQEIAMFRGANNIWADTGDTTLVYRQDVALLLSELISG